MTRVEGTGPVVDSVPTLAAAVRVVARGLLTVRSGGESHHYFNYDEGTAMFRKLIYCFAAVTTALALSACNTMTGVGKDVEKGGQKIQEESKEVQRKL